MANIPFLHIMPEEWSTPLEIRTLRYSFAVARKEGMTRAAEQLHVTQLTLSKQMKFLERELGNILLARHSFSVALTGENRLLRRRVEDLVAMANRITDKFLELNGVLGRDLYLGLAEPHQVCFLAREVRRLKEDCPRMRYHITSDDTEQVTEKLDKGLLNFAILMEEPDTARYEALNLPGANRWGIVTRTDGKPVRKARMDVDDLEGPSLLRSERSWAADLPRWADAHIAELHLGGTFRLTYSDSVFVQEGLGHLLTFTRLADTSGDSGLVFRSLWPVLESPIYLIWHRQQVPSSTAWCLLTQVSTALEEKNTNVGRH